MSDKEAYLLNETLKRIFDLADTDVSPLDEEAELKLRELLADIWVLSDDALKAQGEDQDDIEGVEIALRKDIETAINRNNAEHASNTPDFILAEYITDCLAAYDKSIAAREAYYGCQNGMGVINED